MLIKRLLQNHIPLPVREKIVNKLFGDIVNINEKEFSEKLYMNKKHSEFDKRIHSMSLSDEINIRVAAVSAFVAHQMKKNDPYQFCKNPLDFISIENLSDYDNDWENLVNKIINEAENYQLVWESRTTKFGFQGPND